MNKEEYGFQPSLEERRGYQPTSPGNGYQPTTSQETTSSTPPNGGSAVQDRN